MTTVWADNTTHHSCTIDCTSQAETIQQLSHCITNTATHDYSLHGEDTCCSRLHMGS